MPDRLDPWALGVSTGAVWTIYIAFLGAAANFGWGVEWVELLSNVYVGFNTGVVGILIGCLWAFIDGLIAGTLLATFYNLFRKFKG